MSHKDHTERLILEKSRRLQILKEKAARLGINTPPEILTEIEDIEVELKELQAELEDLKPSETEAISSPIGDGQPTLRARQVEQTGRAERIRAQLEQFYRPIYQLLFKDQAVWKNILGVREEQGSPKQRLAKNLEENIVIPNHNQIVEIIETHLSIADVDENLSKLLQQYINNVEVYKALRSAGEQTMFSIERSDDDWWHQDLFDAVKGRIDELEKEYQELTGDTSK
jgi:hypothetical protein